MMFDLKYGLIPVFLIALCASVQSQSVNKEPIANAFLGSESISGNISRIHTPYNTSGNKLYMIGHQDGSFPDLGWHVKDEMGGIWHHPVKLMDGFEVRVHAGNQEFILNEADSFINFPFGNKLVYHSSSLPLSIQRFQFVPDDLGALYVEFQMKNTSQKSLDVSIEIKAISNLRPVWLGERTGMIDSRDQAQYDENNHYWIVKDSANPWYLIYGSILPAIPVNTGETKPNKPNTSISYSNYSVQIGPDSVYSLPLIIAGSSKSREEAVHSFIQARDQALSLILKKKDRLARLRSRSNLLLSDKELETAFRWIKYNCDWLTQEVEGIGKGICAGYPDYPWWFGGDAAYTLKGLIPTGNRDLVYSTIDLIHSISQKTNGNGRIIHEVSTNGAVFNPGNIGETPQFASMVWEVFCWTGDRAFLNKYFPFIEKGLSWLLKENDPDHNLLPDGNGMMEIHGLNSEMIDVAAYTQKAFADAAQMARILGKSALSDTYKRKADQLRKRINTDFWVPDFNSFADFISNREQALKLVDDAIIRADTLKKSWAVSELKNTRSRIETYPPDSRKGFVMYHNWVVNTPMETGIADTNKAISALNTAQQFTNPFGMFVTGIDRDATAGQDTSSYAATAQAKEFTYTGTVMTLPTGVQIIAENNYGRPDEAYRLLKKLVRTFSYALPGSMYEVSPDYGMMTQAWNMYALGEPVVEQFFGIRPQAYKNEITIAPLLPKALTHGKLEHVMIGNNDVTVGFTQDVNRHVFEIRQKLPDWTILFSQPKGQFKKWVVNNRIVHPKTIGNIEQIRISGNTIHIQLYR